MPKTINQDFSIDFPSDLYDAFSGLSERGWMTPTRLSRFIMMAILPAKLIVEKNKPLKNDEQGFCTKESWYNRANPPEEFNFESFDTNYYVPMATTHTFTSLSVGGIETLEAKKKNPDLNQEYEIFCCGNGQDAMHFVTAYSRITAQPNKSCIFWNYPSVGNSAGGAHAANDLFKAGYQQARRLLEQGIPAKDITLHGLSLGGAVATHVARQLHEEGHLVNLEVDRSFARLSAVVSPLVKNNMLNNDVYGMAPLISSVIALSVSGVALGTTFAGLVASLGLVTASSIAAISYVGACCVQAIGFLLQKIMNVIGEVISFPFGFFSTAVSDGIKTLCNNIGYYLSFPFNLAAVTINEIILKIASFVDSAINLIGSHVGAVVAISGLVVGGLAGLVFGMLLSVQLFWTDKPLLMPMTFAFSSVLYSSCCEMDSVNEVYRLLAADNNSENNEKEQPKISVANTVDDEVIDVVASLNVGLGFKPGEKHNDHKNRFLKEKITSFWYRVGGHGGTPAQLIKPEENDVEVDAPGDYAI